MSRYFDDSDDELTNVTGYSELGQRFSIGFWWKQDSDSKYGTIIRKENTYLNFNIGIDGGSNDRLNLNYTKGDTASQTVTSGNDSLDPMYSSGLWWYWVVTVDAESAFVVNWYRNGVNIVNNFAVHGSGIRSETGQTLSIMGSGGGGYAPGYLAHMQVWSVDLTVAEVMQSMYQPGSVRRGLWGYWPLWGNKSPEPDLGPNGIALTLAGGPVKSLDNPPILLAKRPLVFLFTPSGGGPTAHEKELTESLSLTDTVPKFLIRNLTESLGLTDTAPKQTSRPLTEIMSLSDTLTRAASRALTETLSLSDNLESSVVIVKTLTELLTLSDSIQKQAARILTENVSLSDEEYNALSRDLTETIGLSDSLTRALEKVLPETISLSDVLRGLITVKMLSESLTLSDSIQKLTLRELSELLSLADSITAQTVTLIDKISFYSQALSGPSFTSESLAAGSMASQALSKPEFSSEEVI